MCFCLFTDETETDPNPDGAQPMAAAEPGPMAGSSQGEGRAEVVPAAVNVNNAAATVLDTETDLAELRRINSEYVNSTKAKNTLKKQKSASNKFVDWLRKRGEMRSLDVIPTESLDQLIALWLVDLKRPDGRDYEPNSINSYVSALKCHIAELGHDTKRLEMTAKVVSAKRTELKSRGHGNTPNRASCLSEKQETRLWETGALGDSNPEALVHAVWYCTTKGFGFRGCNEARQLKWGDITKKTTDDGETYLEWNERLTKTRAGNSSHQRPFAPKIFQNGKCPSRCPIRLYELYESKRPSDAKCDAFFLSVNHNRPHDSSAWFVDMPMGVNRLGQIMSRAAKSAGLTDGKFSNHSVRRTMCTQLCQKGVPDFMVAQLSGHKRPENLAVYAVASTEQQHEMNDILQDPSSKINRLPNSSGSFGAIGNAPHSRAVATATTAKSPASSPKHVEAAPATAGTLPISSNTAVSNILDQSTGLRGLLSNATLNGPVTFNFNIHHHHHAATDWTISTQSHM